jgi:hypothetical protein
MPRSEGSALQLSLVRTSVINSLSGFSKTIREASADNSESCAVRHPDFARAVARARGARVDYLETKLLASRKGAETTAAIFALKNASPLEWRDIFAACLRRLISCIPIRGTSIPDGPEWLHEIKYDGFRLRGKRGADVRPDFNWNRPPVAIDPRPYEAYRAPTPSRLLKPHLARAKPPTKILKADMDFLPSENFRAEARTVIFFAGLTSHKKGLVPDISHHERSPLPQGHGRSLLMPRPTLPLARTH